MSYAQFDPASQAPHFLSPQAPARRAARWLPLLGAGLGFAGLIAGVAGCSRPAATTEAAKPVYSDQQVADAKKAVCDAYAKGLEALQVAGSKKPDPTDWLPVAVNTRLAEVTVGNYLINVMDSHPAVPPELQELTRKLALNYQEMATIQLADKPVSEFEQNNRIAADLIPKINEQCL